MSVVAVQKSVEYRERVARTNNAISPKKISSEFKTGIPSSNKKIYIYNSDNNKISLSLTLLFSAGGKRESSTDNNTTKYKAEKKKSVYRAPVLR